jgi:hypothetical protein
MRFVSITLFILAASAAPLLALVPTPRLDALLAQAGTATSLRANLFSYADSAAATGRRMDAGIAWFLAGQSYDRGGYGDSAVACYQRSVALRGGGEERTALAAALLRRQGEGDIAKARGLLEPLLAEGSEGSTVPHGLLAWSFVLSNQPDSAAALFAPVEPLLDGNLEWRFRMAHASSALKDHLKTYRLLWPVAIYSRGTDPEVMEMLGVALKDRVAKARVDSELQRAVRERDIKESRVVQRMGGRYLTFKGEDGFPLGGVAAADSGGRRRFPAVILMAAGDTLADYDSLAVELRAAGFAPMVLDLRGSGRSVGSFCPLPDTWRGREELMQHLCARDVPVALRAFAGVASIDTTRYLVVGAGSAAVVAAAVAEADPRVRGLLLASPSPALVDRGPMRAQLAGRAMPVYLLKAPEDFLISGFVERLYRASDTRASRVDDANVPGTGAKLFNAAPESRARFIRWAGEIAGVQRPRATRPTSPRTR